MAKERSVDLPTETASRVLAWEAPEFTHHQKGFLWMVAVWVVAFGLVAAALWSYHFTFLGILSALVPVAAALALTTQGRLHPETVRIVLDEQGITVKGQLYTWSELKSFWLVFTPLTQTLYFETTRPLLAVVTLQLAKQDPEAVRSALLEHLPERTDRAEEFGDRLSRLIRF